MTDVHVVLTDIGEKHLVHNGAGISELDSPDEIVIEPSGALRFEWTWRDVDGREAPPETLVYAPGMWAGYTVVHR